MSVSCIGNAAKYWTSIVQLCNTLTLCPCQATNMYVLCYIGPKNLNDQSVGKQFSKEYRIKQKLQSARHSTLPKQGIICYNFLCTSIHRKISCADHGNSLSNIPSSIALMMMDFLITSTSTWKIFPDWHCSWHFTIYTHSKNNKLVLLSQEKKICKKSKSMCLVDGTRMLLLVVLSTIWFKIHARLTDYDLSSRVPSGKIAHRYCTRDVSLF